MQGPCIHTGPRGLERSAHPFKTIFHDGFAICALRLGGENIATTLSRWREREGVRPKVALWPVDMIITFPLTAAWRYPVFSDLCKASRPALYQNLIAGCRRATERDFVLSLHAIKTAGYS